MEVSFREDEQLFFDSEARLNKLDDICEAVVNSNVKVAESQEICIFGDCDVIIIDLLNNLKHFFFIFFTLNLIHHILN